MDARNESGPLTAPRNGRSGAPWLAAWTIFAVVLALSIAAFDIRSASVDVVFSDTWGYMHMIDGFLSGAFDPSEILKAHNQNRTAILVGVLAASAQFDHFNQHDIEYLSLAFGLITLANFLYLIHRLLVARPLTAGAVVLIASLSVFSLVQCENLLLSINFVFLATTAFSVTSIVAMARFLIGEDRKKTKAILFILAVVTSELALLSMGGGVVVWAVNLLQIGFAIVRLKIRALGALLVYAAVALASVGAYLWGLSAGGSLSFLLFHPLDALAFFVIGAGNSLVGIFVQGTALGPILWLDCLVGLVFCAIFAFVLADFTQLARAEKKRSLVLVSLILFGLLEQALITYGRLPLSVSNAATSRYSTLTLVAPVAALIFLSLYAEASRICLTLAVVAGLVMVLSTAVSDRNELRIANGRHYLGGLRQRALLENKIGPQDQKLLEWESLSDIQQGNETLRKYRLSFYRGL
jgi:hypothetical protein